ncbi:MAG: sortase, partial [Actinomycetota bacterium]|nr:sortase [Actinomycetota bacterium]
AFPAGATRPDSSNANINTWPQTVANHAIVRVSTRGVAMYTKAGAHMLADVAGWYTGTPTTPVTPVPANPTYNPNRATAVYSAKIGLYVGILTGNNLNAIADAGYAGTWSDLSNVASPGNVMLFAHRTTGNAPFRYINSLHPGDTFSLIGSDGHWYNYRVTNTSVTAPYYTSINSIASQYAPVTAQLVACSRADGSPTSTLYRITVTGRLVSIT